MYRALVCYPADVGQGMYDGSRAHIKGWSNQCLIDLTLPGCDEGVEKGIKIGLRSLLRYSIISQLNSFFIHQHSSTTNDFTSTLIPINDRLLHHQPQPSSPCPTAPTRSRCSKDFRSNSSQLSASRTNTSTTHITTKNAAALRVLRALRQETHTKSTMHPTLSQCISPFVIDQ